MKSVLIAYSEAPGGAARAAFRLHQSLLGQNHDSRMLVRENFTGTPFVETFAPRTDFEGRIRKKLIQFYLDGSYKLYKRTRPKKYADPFNRDRTPLDGREILAQAGDADILNLHWVARFVDYASFFGAVRQPVVWTLHDMNPFTGGCHYNDTCQAYQQHCQRCPQLGSVFKKDLAYKSFERKRSVFDQLAQEQLHFVALSRWMEKEIANSPLVGKFSSTLIPNSLDTSVFCPLDRAALRKVFNISDEKIVLLCTAQLNSNFRKGYHFLVEAMRILASSQAVAERVVIFTIGLNPPKFPTAFKQVNLGVVNHEGMMSIIYNMADAFMLPSLQDNLPNTMLEAMACGTPVVGFNVGGIPDAVIHKNTGYLVEILNAHGLVEAVKEVVDGTDWILKLRNQCRQFVEHNYTPEIQAARYIQLYNGLLN